MGKSKRANKSVIKALKTALNKGASTFSADGKRYRIAKDAGVIEIGGGKGKRKN